MDKDKTDNRIQQNEELSKGKTYQVISFKSVKIKKVLLAIAVAIITSGAYAQTNDQNSNKSQDIKNKNTLNKTNQPSDGYNHPDGYMMQNGKIMMVKNGKMTLLEKDVTLSNGTIIMKDGSYLKKDGTKLNFKEGEHMDMTGNMIPMDKSNTHKKSETGKSLKKDTMYWKSDSIKNKKR